MQNAIEYDQIVAVDYAESNVAIARLTPRGAKPKVVQGAYKVPQLREYLGRQRGTTMLVIEETTTAQYLYSELRDQVTKVLICDPYQNKLLCMGAKNDRIDACKLALLARAGMLKEVYHTVDALIDLRKLLSGYEDVIKAGVRLKNQLSALCRQAGVAYTDAPALPDKHADFIARNITRQIVENTQTRDDYLAEFTRWQHREKRLRDLNGVPGIGLIGAVKILATVIDARRFKKSGNYLGYCGLVLHDKESGNRSYGKRQGRYSRRLKCVYKTAALSAITSASDLHDYYEMLLRRGCAEHNARHAVARQVAISTYGMLKHGTKYEPYRWRKNIAAHDRK